jgi:hypothetical protein
MKQLVVNIFRYFNHVIHTCASHCLKCGKLLQKGYPDFSTTPGYKTDSKKRRIQLSRGFVYLTGLVLFVIVFGGIVVFGNGYVAGDSSINGAEMDFDSSCLWLTGNNYESEQSFDSSTAAGTGSAIQQLDLENTLSDGEITCLRPFRSYKELKQFLDEDLTDEHIYSKSFDCDDFAFMLSQNALNRGYQIFPFAEDNHLKNVAHVALDDTIIVYIVEPQTDEIRIWGKVD